MLTDSKNYVSRWKALKAVMDEGGIHIILHHHHTTEDLKAYKPAPFEHPPVTVPVENNGVLFVHSGL